MIEAKKGNIDIEYFQNIIQEKEELKINFINNFMDAEQ
jgi:hypothetical protein